MNNYPDERNASVIFIEKKKKKFLLCLFTVQKYRLDWIARVLKESVFT